MEPAMNEFVLIIDYKYCTGCHACELSCKNEHGFSPEEFGIKLIEIGPVKLKGSWMWNYLPIPSDLCDLCKDRRSTGAKAACELHCLAQCMEVVALNETNAKMEKTGHTVFSIIP
jgi:Fe-S-cluster-containing dehydrogenase component